jgi:hypothetical protein
MKNKTTMIILIVSAIAVTAVFGAIAYQSVLAATPTATFTDKTNTTSQLDPGWMGGKGPNGGFTNQQLADALGITVDSLNTADQTAYSAALNDAVSKGLITQAQADQLSSKGTVFPFGNRWDGWLTQNGIDFNAYLADALDISVDSLKAAYLTAYNTNIDQMVTDGKLTQAQADLMKGHYALNNDSAFQSSMQSAFTSAVNVAVSSGVITQAQADQILSNSSNMFLPGMGGWGGPGNPHGHVGRDFLPDSNNSPSMTP